MRAFPLILAQSFSVYCSQEQRRHALGPQTLRCAGGDANCECFKLLLAQKPALNVASKTKDLQFYGNTVLHNAAGTVFLLLRQAVCYIAHSGWPSRKCPPSHCGAIAGCQMRHFAEECRRQDGDEFSFRPRRDSTGYAPNPGPLETHKLCTSAGTTATYIYICTAASKDCCAQKQNLVWRGVPHLTATNCWK